MADWWNGGMAEWRNGGMAEWQSGIMYGTKQYRIKVWKVHRCLLGEAPLGLLFETFESCTHPSTIRHHLPHYSWIIMVLTRRSIISQPNCVYHLPHYSSIIMVLTRCSIISQLNCVCTRSRSSMVPCFFALTENNSKAYYSIDRCSGFRMVCPDCPITFL